MGKLITRGFGRVTYRGKCSQTTKYRKRVCATIKRAFTLSQVMHFAPPRAHTHAAERAESRRFLKIFPLLKARMQACGGVIAKGKVDRGDGSHLGRIFRQASFSTFGGKLWKLGMVLLNFDDETNKTRLHFFSFILLFKFFAKFILSIQPEKKKFGKKYYLFISFF